MTKIVPRLLCCIMLFTALPLFAYRLNLDAETIYVRKGFDPSWTLRAPARDEPGWLAIPGAERGTRTAVLKELPLEGIPRRGMFSLKRYPPEDFTFLISFTLEEGSPAREKLMAVFFANIGENWAVYLNGRLIRSEVHLDEGGRITLYRHMREVLIPLDPRSLNPGRNILAVRIIGDPTNIDSGFHRSVPFVIGDAAILERERSELVSLVLIFLYFFIGAYHLFFYVRMTVERHNLYYGAFSVMLFIYLFSRTHAVYAIIPDSTLLHRIEYCSLYALLPLFGAFADLILTGTLSRLTKIYAAFCGVLALITAMPVSNPFAIDILRLWQVTAPVALGYFVFVMIGRPVWRDFIDALPERRNQRSLLGLASAVRRAMAASAAGKLMIGALVVAACALFDILDSMFWAYDYVATQYGFFVFTVGIALILADRFIRSHKLLAKSNEIAQNEIELAGQVQSSLVQEPPAGVAGWDIALAFVPAHGASGDLYDFYASGSRLRGVFLFDVSGHGVSSALITMIAKPLTFRLFNRMHGQGLDRILERVNRHISDEFPRLHNYISCVLLRFAGGMVEYANAGHPDILHRSHKTGFTRAAGEGQGVFRGEPIGVNIKNTLPSVIRFTVRKEDIILLFTDCILESKNRRKERYGEVRLIESLNDAPDGTAREALDFILERFDGFVDRNEIRDDFTVILLKRTS